MKTYLHKDERLPAAIYLIFAACINIVTAAKFWQPAISTTEYLRGIYDKMLISGYDLNLVIFIADGQIVFDPTRHPLAAYMMQLIHLATRPLTDLTGVNCAYITVSLIMTLTAAVGMLFLHRLLRLFRLTTTEATVLTMMAALMGHQLMAWCAGDFFGISATMLIVLLYHVESRRRRGVTIGNTTFCTAALIMGGITVTNALKAALAELLTLGRRTFTLRHMAAWGAAGIILLAGRAAIVPLFGGERQQQYYLVTQAMKNGQDSLVEKLKTDAYDSYTIDTQTDLVVAKSDIRPEASYDELVKDKSLKARADRVILAITKYLNTDISRPDIIAAHWLGESILLHKAYPAHGFQTCPPPSIPYASAWLYLLQAVIITLFALCATASWREPLMRLALSWLAFDTLLHIVIGFAGDESYITASSWLYIIPLSIGCTLPRLSPPRRRALLVLTAGITLLLGTHNIYVLAMCY